MLVRQRSQVCVGRREAVRVWLLYAYSSSEEFVTASLGNRQPVPARGTRSWRLARPAPRRGALCPASARRRVCVGSAASDTEWGGLIPDCCIGSDGPADGVGGDWGERHADRLHLPARDDDHLLEVIQLRRMPSESQTLTCSIE